MKSKNKNPMCAIICGCILMFSSCDSGDIYPKENDGNIVKVNVSAAFKLTNIETFSDNYKIAIATFVGSTPYPGTFTIVEKPSTEGGQITVSINELPSGTTNISLCLLQAVGNKKVYSFFDYPINETPTTDISIPLQNIDIASFGRVQSQVFSQCIQCHGGGSKASAGLYLTPDSAYKYLVNHVAKNSIKNRVTPNSINNSFIMDVLTNKSAVSYNHTDISTLKSEDVLLVESWIKSGAKH